MKTRYHYRIRERGTGFIAERRHPLWFWHYLSGDQACWYSGNEYFAPSPNRYSTPERAEAAIKTAVIQEGIKRAHHIRVRYLPPWTKA